MVINLIFRNDLNFKTEFLIERPPRSAVLPAKRSVRQWREPRRKKPSGTVNTRNTSSTNKSHKRNAIIFASRSSTVVKLSTAEKARRTPKPAECNLLNFRKKIAGR